jgi:hypothetical protein
VVSSISSITDSDPRSPSVGVLRHHRPLLGEQRIIGGLGPVYGAFCRGPRGRGRAGDHDRRAQRYGPAAISGAWRGILAAGAAIELLAASGTASLGVGALRHERLLADHALARARLDPESGATVSPVAGAAVVINQPAAHAARAVTLTAGPATARARAARVEVFTEIAAVDDLAAALAVDRLAEF